MAKKSKLNMIFKCESCGELPKRIEEQSNENWNVIPVICEKCGGKIKPSFE